MVFEHLFPESLLERREWTGFVLAFIYSTLAIIIARLLFPANSGLVAVVFVSIFLLPYFSMLLRREERQESQDAYKSFFGLLKDNSDIIRTYFFIFMGIYLAFMLYTFLAPFLGIDIGRVFREQLSLEVVRGGAVFSAETFWQIMLNNWWVLLACFLVALVAGDGAIFFIAWNASTWGTIFGYRAVAAGAYDGTSALVALLIIFLITLPHVLIEGGAYILAAISGGVISDQVVEQAEEVRSFVVYFIGAALLYVILYMLLRAIIWNTVVLGVLAIVIAFGILYLMQFIFSGTRETHVFTYNLHLFMAAVLVFLIGALLETYVLMNATPLREVYMAAYLAG